MAGLKETDKPKIISNCSIYLDERKITGDKKRLEKQNEFETLENQNEFETLKKQNVFETLKKQNEFETLENQNEFETLEKQNEFETKVQQWIDGKVQDFVSFALLNLDHLNVEDVNSPLCQLFDSLRSQLKTKVPEWNKHRDIFYLMKSILNLKDRLSDVILRKMFDYLTALIDRCDDKETIDHIWDVFDTFPFHKALLIPSSQALLLELINLIENLINTSPGKWYNHRKLCELLCEVLFKSNNCLSLTNFDRMFHYLVKLMEGCNDEETSNGAWTAFKIFPFDKSPYLLLKYIDLVENTFDAEKSGLDRHDELLYGNIKETLKNYKDSLSYQICVTICDYLIKKMRTCENKEKFDSAWRVMKKLPFFRHQSLLLKVVHFIENPLNKEQTENKFSAEESGFDKHKGLCRVMKKLLMLHEDLLIREICEQIFGYLIKLIETCEHDQTIVFALDALAFFRLDKFPSSLLHLLNTMDKQLKQFRWGKHGKMCVILRQALSKWSDYFSHEIIDQSFDYLVKLLEICNHEETIELAWRALRQFQFYNYQALLMKLNDLMEKMLITEVFIPDWHQRLCCMMQELLMYRKNSLSRETCERMFDYLVKLMAKCDHDKTIATAWRTLTYFPFSEHQSSLELLIDYVENKWNQEQCRELCELMRTDLFQYEESLSLQTCKRIFDYLVKLIETCDNWITIESACAALSHFPFSKYQSLLLNLINLMTDKLNAEQRKFESKIHGELRDPMNENVLNDSLRYRMLVYLLKLIEKCDDEGMIDAALSAIKLLPNDIKFLVLEAFNLLTDQLNVKHDCDWTKHKMLLILACNLIENHKNDLNFKTIDLISNYMTGLFDQCENIKIIFLAVNVFINLPYNHCLETLKLKLMHNINNQLEASDWFRHRNLCLAICLLLEKCEICFQELNHIFAYVAKLFFVCEDKETIDWAVQIVLKFELSLVKNLFDRVISFTAYSVHEFNATLYTNLCKLIEFVIYKDCTKLPKLETDFFNFFEIVLDEKIHKATLTILLTFEKLCLKINANSSKLANIERKILSLSLHNLDIKDLKQIDFHALQVNWCARWVLENILSEGVCLKEFPLLKLSGDRLSVRNDGDDRPPVRASYSVRSGIYFYEVICIENLSIQIGWSSRSTQWSSFETFGQNNQSIYLDTSQKCLVICGEKLAIKNFPDLNLDFNVIGCLFNMANHFVFYINGQKIAELFKRFDAFCIFYPTVCLSQHQQCHFNFGQTPFKFAPKDIPFRNFHKASGGDARRYQLEETSQIFENYWFKHSPVDNQVDLLFCDLIQHKCDEVVKRVETDIKEIGEWELENENTKNSLKSFKSNHFSTIIQEKYFQCIQFRIECVRYIQSIIEVMGRHVIKDDKIDLMAQWIGKYIIQFDADIYMNNHFGFQYRLDNSLLLELIYPYLQLKISVNSNEYQHRSICIVLLQLIQCQHRIVKFIRNEIFAYLVRVFTATKDKWTKLFVLLALENIQLRSDEQTSLTKKEEFMNLFEWISDFQCEKIVEFLTMNSKPFNLPYQLHFVSKHFLGYIRNLKTGQIQTEFNSNDQTEHIKTSTDFLSVRSDWKWQSMRSRRPRSLDLSEMFYFETILITSGQMRIGWTTKRTNLTFTQVGGDKFSIAYDGFNRCVWHRGNQFDLVDDGDSFPRWKSGDVVGCLIEVKNDVTTENQNKTRNINFSFFLNGRPIAFDQNLIKIKSTQNQFHSSVSLSSHQHVYFIFDKTLLKFAPKSYADRKSEISNILTVRTRSSSEIDLDSPPQTKRLCIAHDHKASLEIDSLEDQSTNLQIDQIDTNVKAKRPIKFTHKWSIKNFNFPFQKDETPLSVVYSETFPVSDEIMFSLRLVPTCEEDHTFVSIFLYLEQCSLKCAQITVNYEITIVNVDPKQSIIKKQTQDFRVEDFWGWDKFVNRNDLLDPSKGFITNNMLTIICIVKIDNELISIERNQTENNFDCKIKVNRFDYSWEIKKFSSFFRRKNEDIPYFQSKIFPSTQNSHNRYFLRLWPKGIDEEAEQFVSIYLFLESSTQENIDINYRVSILDLDGDIFHSGEGRGRLQPIKSGQIKSSGKGSSKFIALERILNPENGLLPEDKLTIFCEIEEKLIKKN